MASRNSLSAIDTAMARIALSNYVDELSDSMIQATSMEELESYWSLTTGALNVYLKMHDLAVSREQVTEWQDVLREYAYRVYLDRYECLLKDSGD